VRRRGRLPRRRGVRPRLHRPANPVSRARPVRPVKWPPRPLRRRSRYGWRARSMPSMRR
jgi:hypothetical protein